MALDAGRPGGVQMSARLDEIPPAVGRQFPLDLANGAGCRTLRSIRANHAASLGIGFGRVDHVSVKDRFVRQERRLHPRLQVELADPLLSCVDVVLLLGGDHE